MAKGGSGPGIVRDANGSHRGDHDFFVLGMQRRTLLQWKRNRDAELNAFSTYKQSGGKCFSLHRQR